MGAAYACRWMAKSVVKSGLCKRACVQLSYAIGVAKPLSLFVETYGTENGDLTAAYCHFGRTPYTEDGKTFFAWEDAKDLAEYAKMSAGDVEKAVKKAQAEILTKWVD